MIKNSIIVLSAAAVILWNCAPPTHAQVEPESKAIQEAVKEKIVISETEIVNDIIDLGQGWYQVAGRVEILKNMTQEEAESKAIELACINAIQYHSGLELHASSVAVSAVVGQDNVMDSFASISQQTTQGIILEKLIISKEIRVHDARMTKVVTLKVKVGKQKGEIDPYFKLDAHLNRDHFKNGDVLEMSVKATKDCYLTILNLSSNDSVYVLAPNTYRPDNFLKANDSYNFPNEKDKIMGIILRVALLDGKKEDVEMIKIIATKQPLHLIDFNNLSAWGSATLALEKLQKRLVELPSDEVAEVDLPYFINE
jgi:hypothetical protein